MQTPMGWMHPACAGAPMGAPAHQQGGSEALGTIVVFVPFLATLLIWFWVGSMNLFQDPAGSLMLLSIGTVVGTALLMAVEASQLGMGTRLDSRGKKGSSPAAWFVLSCLAWFIAFPWYLDQRRYYGRRPLAVAGILIGLLFIGSTFSMGARIEAQKSRVRDSLEQMRSRFGQ